MVKVNKDVSNIGTCIIYVKLKVITNMWRSYDSWRSNIGIGMR